MLVFRKSGSVIFIARGFFPIFYPFWLPPSTYKSSSGQKRRMAPYTTINNNASDQKKKQLFDDETIDSTMSVAYKCSLFSEHENISSLRGGGGLVLYCIRKKKDEQTNEGVCTWRGLCVKQDRFLTVALIRFESKGDRSTHFPQFFPPPKHVFEEDSS